jgi:hypothetical protein
VAALKKIDKKKGGKEEGDGEHDLLLNKLERRWGRREAGTPTLKREEEEEEGCTRCGRRRAVAGGGKGKAGAGRRGVG